MLGVTETGRVGGQIWSSSPDIVATKQFCHDAAGPCHHFSGFYGRRGECKISLLASINIPSKCDGDAGDRLFYIGNR
ncbi:hypothetical protein VTI28DRAFT_4761 [Corynascus sepedonium]